MGWRLEPSKTESTAGRTVRQRSAQVATTLVWLALGQTDAGLAKNLLHGPDGRSLIRQARNAAGSEGAHLARHRNQIPRQGFSLPRNGERRFLPNEVVLEIPANISVPALEALAHRHHLTLIGSIESSTPARRDSSP